eukprot:2062168-Prymnesium_polylepis.1
MCCQGGVQLLLDWCAARGEGGHFARPLLGAHAAHTGAGEAGRARWVARTAQSLGCVPRVERGARGAHCFCDKNGVQYSATCTPQPFARAAVQKS